MRSKRVLRPIQSVEEVQASLDTFGGTIADRLDGRHSSPEGEGDAPGAPFSYRDVFDDLGSDLESLRQSIVVAEDEHVHRQAGAAAVRRQLAKLGTDLYDHQVAARRVLLGAFDPSLGFELAAVSGETPRTFKPLEEQVDQTIKLLRNPVVEDRSVAIAGVEVELGTMADGLEGSLTGFRDKRSELDRARKAVGESKVLLDRALAEFQGRFPWIAQALEGYARMVGERELADRIRTSIRRVTRRQDEPEEESDPDSTAEASSDAPSAAEVPAGESVSDEIAVSETASNETPSEVEASSEEAQSSAERSVDSAAVQS